MAKEKATVRVKKIDYGGKTGQAYYARIDGQKVWFPVAITTVEEIGDCVDLTVDAWYARKNNLETIAEWLEN